MARLRRADASDVLAESYAVNDRMNQLVLEQLDPRGGRTIAAIFSHVHNMRRKWLRLSAPHLKIPAPVNRASCTPEQARAALAESAATCCEMIREAQIRPGGRVKNFRRDGWAKPWPAGPAMVGYMIAHDAHHRGQVCMLAHQLGFPLRGKGAYGIWAWETLWKECGFTHPR